MLRFCWTPRFGFQSVGKLFVGPSLLSPGGNVVLAFFRRGQSTVPKVSHSESPFGFLRSQVRPQASSLRFLRFQDVRWCGYGSIPIDTFLVGWTSIYQLFWCSPGVQGFDPSPCQMMSGWTFSSQFRVHPLEVPDSCYRRMTKKARDICVFYSWTYNLNAGVCLQRKVMNEWPQ